MIQSWLIAALGRARRRRSRWNLLLLGVALPLWAFLWWGGFRLVWAYHVRLYPRHAGALSQFWPAGISRRAFVASFLMVFGPMIPAVVLALLVTNLLVWLVRPARLTLEAEASTVPGTTFRESQRKLLIAAMVAIAGGAFLGMRGAAMLTGLR